MSIVEPKPFSPRTRIAIAVALAALVALMALVPRLIEMDRVRAQVIDQLNRELGGEASIGRLEWHWLPLPHLAVYETRFASEEVELTLPEGSIYPKWWTMFAQEVQVARVLLDQPEIAIKRLPITMHADRPLPNLDITVIDGSLSVAANDSWHLFHNRSFTVSSLSLDTVISSGSVELSATGVPSFGDYFDISATIPRKDDSFRLEADLRKVRLHEAFSEVADGTLAMTESATTLKASLQGRGQESFKARLNGDLPGVIAAIGEKKLPFTGGNIDLTAVRTGQDLLVRLGRLSFAEPGLTVTGTVRRSASTAAGGDPLWQLDLKGNDLALAPIRQALLARWPDNFVVKTVCGIVLDGVARKASYAFHGSTGDFHFVRNMEISAETDGATIAPPVGGLVLKETKGSMRIKDGKLTVAGESARLGNSSGRDCRLVLGLPSDDHEFRLDVDIDADVADLPGVLKGLVHHQRFQEELARFRKAEGRASGHLHVGEDLRDLAVTVRVDSMRGKGEYNRLSKPFSIEAGQLQVAPGSVEWKEVRGALGPHRVARGSGKVTWNGETRLAITELDGSLDAGEALAADLSFFGSLVSPITENITRASGTITVSNTRISGMATDPATWQGGFDLGFGKLSVESPRLPVPLEISGGKASIGNARISLANLTATLFGDPITAHAELSHAALANFQGNLVLQGRVGQELGQWLREQRIVPESLFPRLPMAVETLALTLRPERGYAVRGLLAPIVTAGKAPKVDFSVDSSPENPMKLAMRVTAPDEEAKITLDLLDRTRETFLFSWKGRLSGKTASLLLARQELLQGTVAGDFQLHAPKDPTKISASGQLDATALRLPLAGSPDRILEVPELRLTGTGHGLQVRNLSLNRDECQGVRLSGSVTPTTDGVALSLDLAARSLTRQAALRLQEDLKRLRGEQNPGGHPWRITGTVRFNLEEFLSGPPAEPTLGRPPATLVWRPLIGEIRILPEWKMSATISGGRLCCLSTTGEWFSTPSLGQSNFQLKSICEEQPRFENVLPCLGYPQDIIEGAFSLDGRLAGEKDNWHDGEITITSQQGRILRMKLLSRIFSVVNLTDLLRWVEPGDEGHGKGFPYTDLLFKGHIKENELIINEAVIRGEGLNLFIKGRMHLTSFQVDAVVMVSPLKTIDAIIAKIPLLGRVIGGETGTVVTFPVAVTGNIADPQVTLLPPSEVGEGVMNIIKRAITLPFNMLAPLFCEPEKPGEKK
ncbi:MAG: AsmA-like C-terminal domain-containing protein [Thermodesulfobacteriota bacterium]